VGGKKMDWAKEHQAPGKIKSDWSIIHLAAYFNQVESIKFLLSKETTKTVSKFGEKVEKYFNFRATNSHGLTACHYAVSGNAPKALKAIIDADSKANGELLVNMGDSAGVVPLALAASVRISSKEKKDVEVIQVLLDCKVDITCVDKERGWTPLHFAAYSNNVEAVELLLKSVNKQGANLPSNKFKQTPLIIATFKGNHEVVKLLLKDDPQKCDPLIKDSGGNFPLHYASAHSNPECVKLLIPKPQNKKEIPLHSENGVGLTPLDSSMLKMLSIFHADRKNNVHYHQSGYKHIPQEEMSVYKHLMGVQEHQRVLTKGADVVATCALMMETSTQGQEGVLYEGTSGVESYQGITEFPVSFSKSVEEQDE